MASVRLTSEFGLVVRKAALAQRGLAPRALLDALEAQAPLDESAELLSFGPHFGAEAATELVRRLEALGLIPLDDFFVFAGDFPDWCTFSAALARS